MKRGELARRSGCSAETIRYYENIGLIAPERSAAGHRIYHASDRARLRFVLRARELGFSIPQLRSLLELVDSGTMTCGEVEAIARLHLDNVREKLRDLARLERTLAKTLAECEGSEAPDCALIDALFEEA